MKLASLKRGGRDGTLIVVNRNLTQFVTVTEVAATLQQAIDDWPNAAPRLNAVSEALNQGQAGNSQPLDYTTLASPFPRAYEFVDGSAYLPHVERVRRARGAEVPESFYQDPLMYQATSAGFLGPRDSVPVPSEEYGIDFEAEVVVVTDDVPMAVSAARAADHIQLVGLINDVSLRNLIPAELAKGFGFVHSKPRSALSPVRTHTRLSQTTRSSITTASTASTTTRPRYGYPEQDRPPTRRRSCSSPRARRVFGRRRTRVLKFSTRFCGQHYPLDSAAMVLPGGPLKKAMWIQSAA